MGRDFEINEIRSFVVIRLESLMRTRNDKGVNFFSTSQSQNHPNFTGVPDAVFRAGNYLNSLIWVNGNFVASRYIISASSDEELEHIACEQILESTRGIPAKPFSLLLQQRNDGSLNAIGHDLKLAACNVLSQLNLWRKAGTLLYSGNSKDYRLTNGEKFARENWQVVPVVIRTSAIGGNDETGIRSDSDDACRAQWKRYAQQYDRKPKTQLPRYMRFTNIGITASWPEGDSVVFDMSNVDVDVSEDSQHWFHLSGQLCFRHYRGESLKSRPTPQRIMCSLAS
jgi:hypothetical protein